MTWRWVTSFKIAAAAWCTAVCCATAWCATVSGKVELADSKVAQNREHDNGGVVVWLEPLAGTLPPRAMATATIAHRNKTFVPHVQAVRTGSKIAFPNLDPFFHNAFSNYDGQVFDIGLHPPGSTREQTFSRPGIVRLFCNIHPTMSAVIVVLDTPYFAVTNAQGAFRMTGVPAGEYRIKLFHERALPEALKALERQVTVSEDGVVLPSMTVSEAG